VQFFSLHNYAGSNNNPATWQAKFFTGPTASDGSSSPGTLKDHSARGFIDQLREVMKIRMNFRRQPRSS